MILDAVQRLGLRSRAQTIVRTITRFHRYKHHMRPDSQLQIATTALSKGAVARLTNLRQFQGARLALQAEATQGILRLKTAAEALLADESASPKRRQQLAERIRARLGDIEAFDALMRRGPRDGSSLAAYGLDARTLAELAERLASKP